MLHWHTSAFHDLTPNELYEILALRISVFVVEQNCSYQEADGKDQESYHLFANDESGKTVAYLRLVKPGISYDEWSIGRVVSDPNARMKGLGKEVMKRGLEWIHTHHGKLPVRISAQLYLKMFYEDFGFVQVSESYLEDDIPHIEMLYTP
ncbi:MAG: GNAT family N-acetyltransferase [Flavobacteriales bacterium]|nr:GNAT family N-acetyltransferase [Flavobacteriales bacterium]